MSRLAKQILIASIFALILISLGLGIYFLVVPRASCTDGIQNGKEEGVDCGLNACGFACEEILPMRLVSSKLLEVGTGDYDFIAQVHNPNAGSGSSAVSYQVEFLDRGGQVAKTQPGSFYILPGQTRYIVLQAIKSAVPLSNARFTFGTAAWQKTDLADSAKFIVKAKSYKGFDPLNIDQPAYSQMEGVISNLGGFDFRSVNVVIVLFNSRGDIVGVNKTILNNLVAGVDRYFLLRWPFLIPEAVTRSDVEVTTNVFNTSNFLNSNGSLPQKSPNR